MTDLEVERNAVSGLMDRLYIVLDGTGRFEGVTGTISMFGTMDIPNLVWTLEGEGTINFHGC